MTDPLRFDSLCLDLPFMDEAHEQLMRLLAIVEEADDAHLPAAWRDLVECIAQGFAREDRWMNDTGYASRRDHQVQHRVVLEVLRDGITQVAEGRLLHVRQMAWQLRDWYRKHVQTMDAALALHLRGRRFDPANGGSGPSRSSVASARAGIVLRN
ncbi:hemerythrin [Variovorax ureilyticus]|uniref:Hemerythrin n=1 Tax=Variovorax ureilyticus TaxID=1836198 RepID=A0ABU8VGN2_9BURK